jgi:hypothetical protein
MNFEVLGEVSAVETFAAGSGIREVARLRKVYGRGRWRKRKVSLESDFPMVLSVWLSYTGMKLPGSVARK